MAALLHTASAVRACGRLAMALPARLPVLCVPAAHLHISAAAFEEAVAQPSTTPTAAAMPPIGINLRYNLPADLKVRAVDGKLLKPRLSAREAARVRKDLILHAAEMGSDAALRWDDSWDRLRKAAFPRIPKGTRHANKRKERVEKVKAAIVPALQEKKLADYKKTLPAKPISEGLLKWVKKNAWEKD